MQMLKPADVTGRKEWPGQEWLKGGFLPVYKYTVHWYNSYNKFQLLDELLVLKMFWHCVQKSSWEDITGLQFSQQLQREVLAVLNFGVNQKHPGVKTGQHSIIDT